MYGIFLGLHIIYIEKFTFPHDFSSFHCFILSFLYIGVREISTLVFTDKQTRRQKFCRLVVLWFGRICLASCRYYQSQTGKEEDEHDGQIAVCLSVCTLEFFPDADAP